MFLRPVLALLLIVMASRFGAHGQRIQLCGKALMRHYDKICEGKNTFKRSFLGLPSHQNRQQQRLIEDLNSLRGVLTSDGSPASASSPSSSSSSSLNELLNTWIVKGIPEEQRRPQDSGDAQGMQEAFYPGDMEEEEEEYPSEDVAYLGSSRHPMVAKRGNFIRECCQKSCLVSDLAAMC